MYRPEYLSKSRKVLTVTILACLLGNSLPGIAFGSDDSSKFGIDLETELIDDANGGDKLYDENKLSNETYLERLKRERPAEYFRQKQSSDDPVIENFTRSLFDQYAAATLDKNELESYVARASTGFVKSEMRVDLLKNQMALLQRDIYETEISKRKAEEYIAKVQADIQRKKIEGERIRMQVKAQEDVVKVYLRAMQDDIDQSAIELLLSSESFAHAVDKVSYLETVKEEGSSNIDKLKNLRDKLNKNLDAQQADEQAMADLKATIDEQEQYLIDQRREKAFLMVRTKGQQDLYEKLLEEAYQKRAEIEKEMDALVSALALVGNPSALNELGPSPYPVGAFGPISSYGFIWPVPPEKVTTYFQDPEYVKLFGFNHDAVDLRASQGTEVRAASDGVVYAAKDNGLGYSFVVLVHRDGYSTVYGHLSDIQVREGEVVRQGDLIGLSGGAVGTKGAGYYTTGPHLHFEVRLRGEPKDPLVYLP